MKSFSRLFILLKLLRYQLKKTFYIPEIRDFRQLYENKLMMNFDRETMYFPLELFLLLTTHK